MTFHLVVKNCKPFARILSYKFICKATGFTLAICEVAKEGFSIVDHKDMKGGSFDIDAEVAKFNKEMLSIAIPVTYSQINVQMQMKKINDGLTEVGKKYPGKQITPLEFGQATAH
mmetsp:Transcript_11179/g.16966  ORF Transcript_11179/g.16966 Transcript_11179/m.16966 type:complete len:115 (-) Transcript_11179:821-1165(-)